MTVCDSDREMIIRGALKCYIEFQLRQALENVETADMNALCVSYIKSAEETLEVLMAYRGSNMM